MLQIVQNASMLPLPTTLDENYHWFMLALHTLRDSYENSIAKLRFCKRHMSALIFNVYESGAIFQWIMFIKLQTEFCIFIDQLFLMQIILLLASSLICTQWNAFINLNWLWNTRANFAVWSGTVYVFFSSALPALHYYVHFFLKS